MPADLVLSDARALVAAIHAAPDDDAPRLILADWLDDHGEGERAALIRRMVAAPSYSFAWNQTRHNFRPRHSHREPIKAIRGLKPRLSALCREEWGRRPLVEHVVMRRGFAESISIPAYTFLVTAGDLFGRHPFRAVELTNLRPGWGWDLDAGQSIVNGVLAVCATDWGHWPAALFPERAVGDVVTYPHWPAALADLSRRAVGFGRRAAGVVLEPPPLPAMPPPPPGLPSNADWVYRGGQAVDPRGLPVATFAGGM